jgi:hypothetical protein
VVQAASATAFDAEGLRALVYRLSRLGGNARWVSRFVPTMLPDADPRTCTRYPFAHVKIGQRAELRAAYAALLKERVARHAPPVKVPPPPVTDRAASSGPLLLIEDGCLFCGIATQVVSAVEVAQEGHQNVASRVWVPRRIGSTQLGLPSPATLSGFLCQVCNEAVEHVHSIGPTALERALVTVLAPEKLGTLGWGNTRVSGLVGWGALFVRARQQQPDPEPNARPWRHLGDLAAITRQLRLS